MDLILGQSELRRVITALMSHTKQLVSKLHCWCELVREKWKFQRSINWNQGFMSGEFVWVGCMRAPFTCLQNHYQENARGMVSSHLREKIFTEICVLKTLAYTTDKIVQYECDTLHTCFEYKHRRMIRWGLLKILEYAPNAQASPRNYAKYNPSRERWQQDVCESCIISWRD